MNKFALAFMTLTSFSLFAADDAEKLENAKVRCESATKFFNEDKTDENKKELDKLCKRYENLRKSFKSYNYLNKEKAEKEAEKTEESKEIEETADTEVTEESKSTGDEGEVIDKDLLALYKQRDNQLEAFASYAFIICSQSQHFRIGKDKLPNDYKAKGVKGLISLPRLNKRNAYLEMTRNLTHVPYLEEESEDKVEEEEAAADTAKKVKKSYARLHEIRACSSGLTFARACNLYKKNDKDEKDKATRFKEACRLADEAKEFRSNLDKINKMITEMEGKLAFKLDEAITRDQALKDQQKNLKSKLKEVNQKIKDRKETDKVSTEEKTK